MDEDEDLSPEQTEKLLQFQDLTGIEEIDRCREILGQHNWDMEVAVQSRFSEQAGQPSAYAEARRDPPTPTVDIPVNQRITTIARARPHGWLQWGYFVVLFPFRFVYSTLMDVLRFAYRLLRPDPRRYVTDPLGNVISFIQRFEESYGTEHPEFYRGPYSQALNEAKRDLRFLLVYLHGDDHQDTDSFCRQTLCNAGLTDFINSHLIFWACNTNSPEGYRVSQALRENTYPFFALITLRQNRMTVVARIEGPIEADDLVARLSRIMQDNESSLIEARRDKEARDFNQTLRQQQDMAYQASLHADREKDKRRREEEQQRQRQEQEVKEKLLQEQRKQEERVQRKEEIRNTMPQEPDADHPDAVKVLLKLPNGVRLERRFLKTDSLKHLYNYVFVHEAAPDDFQIVTNFPRRTLPCQPTEDNLEPPTFSEFGLGKSEMLFVHDNEA